MAETRRTGACLCGAIRVEATGTPVSLNYCHCRSCRKASGAPVVAWVTFPAAAVKFNPQPQWFKSSDRAERAFCPKCGGSMVWRAISDPAHIDITTVTFDDPDDPALRPKEHLWIDDGLKWFRVRDGLPKYHSNRKSGTVED